MLKTILVPLDGSEHAKAALEPAADLLCALAVPGQEKVIHLTRVVKPLANDQKDATHILHNASDITRARHSLRQTAEQIQEGSVIPSIAKRHIQITGLVVLDNDIAGRLIRIAEPGRTGTPGACELIAISTHGRGGLQRWTLGSITERVLHATTLPLLIVRPADTTSTKALSLENVSAALR